MSATSPELAWFEPLSDLIRVGSRDSVPVLHVAAPGPVRGGIAFRVGAADERLPERGLTHLVEHLALRGQLAAPDHRNGMTGSTITQFIVTGSEDEVVAFLNHVCAALSDLPLDELEAERAVLRVEAERRASPVDVALVRSRYGATGRARETFREFGMEVGTPEQVRAWAQRWFVRGNAVAWITSERVPVTLDLGLPEGPRRDFVALPGVDQARPIWFGGADGLVVIDAVVQRSTAASLLASVLSKTLFRVLRTEGGLSYTAAMQYEPLDSSSARLVVYSDAARDDSTPMVQALLEILVAAREGRFDAGDRSEAIARADEEARHVVTQPESLIPAIVYNYLLGGEEIELDAIAGERAALTDKDLAEVARAFWNDAIWQVPTPLDPSAGVAPIAPRADERVDGLSYFSAATSDRVVIGSEGVSVVTGKTTATVLYDDCELTVQWGDGGRFLLARSGAGVLIEPTVLKLFGEPQLAQLDAAVPPHTVVSLPARPENEIPKLHAPAKSRVTGLGWWMLGGGLLVAGLAAVFLVTSALPRTALLSAIAAMVTAGIGGILVKRAR